MSKHSYPTDTTAFNEGRIAFLEKKYMNNNPYIFGSQDWYDWNNGFVDALEENSNGS